MAFGKIDSPPATGFGEIRNGLFCYYERRLAMNLELEYMDHEDFGEGFVITLRGKDEYIKHCVPFGGPMCSAPSQAVNKITGLGLNMMECLPNIFLEIPVGKKSTGLYVRLSSPSLAGPSTFTECDCPIPCDTEGPPDDLDNTEGFTDMLNGVSIDAASFIMNALKQLCVINGSITIDFGLVCLISKTPCDEPPREEGRSFAPIEECDEHKLTIYGNYNADHFPLKSETSSRGWPFPVDEIGEAPWTDKIDGAFTKKDEFCEAINEGGNCLDKNNDGEIDPGMLEKFADCLSNLLKPSGTAKLAGFGGTLLGFVPGGAGPGEAGANAAASQIIKELKDCLCED